MLKLSTKLYMQLKYGATWCSHGNIGCAINYCLCIHAVGENSKVDEFDFIPKQPFQDE